jgi:hypothetical protein
MVAIISLCESRMKKRRNESFVLRAIAKSSDAQAELERNDHGARESWLAK